MHISVGYGPGKVSKEHTFPRNRAPHACMHTHGALNTAWYCTSQCQVKSTWLILWVACESSIQPRLLQVGKYVFFLIHKMSQCAWSEFFRHNHMSFHSARKLLRKVSISLCRLPQVSNTCLASHHTMVVWISSMYHQLLLLTSTWLNIIIKLAYSQSVIPPDVVDVTIPYDLTLGEPVTWSLSALKFLQGFLQDSSGILYLILHAHRLDNTWHTTLSQCWYTNSGAHISHYD